MAAKHGLNIVFMGTPEFAVPSLERLIDSEHRIQAVVTGSDKPAGRGQQLRPTAIKKCALNHRIPILTPKKLKDPTFHQALKDIPADLYVVVAFRILPPAVFTIPPLGTINLHASLLPKYRGAAPINWAIINGEKETGVTTFFIDQNVDTGHTILSRAIPIGDNETAGDLHDKLAVIGAEVLLETVNLIKDGKAERHPQQGMVTYAPKITRETSFIDWSMDAEQVRNLVRGLMPYPGATTFLNGLTYKICEVRHEPETDIPDEAVPGEIIGVDKAGKIVVKTGAGAVAITALQPASKRRMSADEYLRGYVVNVGDVFQQLPR